MAYQQRKAQWWSISNEHYDKKRYAKKLATVLLSAVPMLTVLSTASLLSGCNFHLRGYDAPLSFDVAKTAIILEDNRISFPLQLPLTKSLKALGADVVDSNTVVASEANNSASSSNAEQIATIAVNNLRFKRYELVGVLTEIRLVLSADVTYKTYQNGEAVTLTNPIQVERSYQYNEASVSTDDQQGSQIRDWLYDSLARRITDQYVAISLPRVAPTMSNTSSASSVTRTTDTVIAPITP